MLSGALHRKQPQDYTINNSEMTKLSYHKEDIMGNQNTAVRYGDTFESRQHVTVAGQMLPKVIFKNVTNAS